VRAVPIPPPSNLRRRTIRVSADDRLLEACQRTIWRTSEQYTEGPEYAPLIFGWTLSRQHGVM
jgi:hypothetical protein